MHPVVMISAGYFKGSKLVQMSNGTYCLIRDLGLVKGGKGLRHHENLLTLSVMGLISKLFSTGQRKAGRPPGRMAMKLTGGWYGNGRP